MDQGPDISVASQELPSDGFGSPEISSLDFLTLANFDNNLTNLAHNFSWLFNVSEGLNIDLINKFQRNRRVNDGAYYALIVVYSLLIVLGSTGNSLVVVAVIRKPAMRTARNVFIINLAISDLLLCLVTMPLTLVELLSQYWPLGDHPFLCKLVGTLQATSIFVSTISITAIALDRYQDTY
ncbi:neuropeptide F receptor-like [Homarus americanus]|uniref:neuropeptide F receptor-like n=1 Tax=Homarus americanus TaxID=6706 RepID=UPI001C4872B3|nr:neuropeptide F receptor-like [Homarus americanus]